MNEKYLLNVMCKLFANNTNHLNLALNNTARYGRVNDLKIFNYELSFSKNFLILPVARKKEVSLNERYICIK